MPIRSLLSVAGSAASLLALTALSGWTQAASQPSVPAVASGVTFIGSYRLRWEDWNWFASPTGDGTYNFFGSLLRFGIQRQTSKDDFALEFAAPAFINLPLNAAASAPQGALGLGANYRAASGNQSASLFLKQGYVRFKNVIKPTDSLRIGRFEFSDGSEVATTDPALNWVKQNRISQRLIGPFGFTHVGRSLDGFHYINNTPKQNTTFLFAFPTRGVFDIHGWDTLINVPVAYCSATTPRKEKRGNSETRLFAIYYGDARQNAVKVDNRPAPVRTADGGDINIGTLGGHYLRALPLGEGTLDGMLWFAGQFGQWGALRHSALSVAAEFGYQWPKAGWKPWIRGGYSLASGDGDPTNSQHGTFNPLLPTPRIYARAPFFTTANLQDAFLQVILRPNPNLTLRTDVHGLWLADSSDLWYAGGGAFNNSAFGYIGRPSGGSNHLGTLFDLSVDWQFQKQTMLSFYLGYVKGGGVVSNSYNGTDSTFGYVEVTHRF